MADQTVMTPWMVKGVQNYMKLIDKFGTNAISSDLVKRWERVTKMKAHTFLRRGLVFSHQDLESILDDVEAGKPVYLYTGRGPSTDSMHLGHLVPFLFTKYLQDALNCIVIIQMSDDEKFFFKDGGSKPSDLDNYRKLAYKNAVDIIACGFDINKTFIFSNLEFNGGMLYFNNCLVMKSTTINQIRGTYGLGETCDPNILQVVKDAIENSEYTDSGDYNIKLSSEQLTSCEKFIETYEGKKESNNIGQVVWPAFQSGPAYCTSFNEIFMKAIEGKLSSSNLTDSVAKPLNKTLNELLKGVGNIRCLVPMAIDQAPYFRMARDVAGNIQCLKPAVIHSEFLPGLQQSSGGKMSSTGTGEQTTLFLDIDPTKISKMIKSYAFSGGQITLDDHRKYGGDIKTDISYQYLTYFLDDDVKLTQIAKDYTEGNMTSGEIKEIAATLISNIIKNHQENKKNVTPQIIQQFFDSSRLLDIGGLENRPPLDESQMISVPSGIEFDRTFGFSNKKNTSSVSNDV